MSLPTLLRRTLAVALPVLAALALAAWLVAGRSPPQRDVGHESVRAVAAIRAPEVAWVPRAIGYGIARPARTWRAVAEVPGRVVHRHRDLQAGVILSAGTTLFQIERTDYELAVAEAEAAMAARKSRLADLDAREASLRHSLEIEERRLEVTRRELQRQERLLKQESVSRAEVDRQRGEHLQQQRAVQELENSLAQIPAERQRLQAELERERARLQKAQRDLPRTTISAPFDLRVSKVSAEVDQYVRTGETLMEGDDVSATEVEAQVPVDRFRAILEPVPAEGPGSPARVQERLAAMGLSAQVRLRASGARGTTVRWPARVDRVGDAIDARARTVGVVAVVDRPYEKAEPPQRPPLVKGMYVEVAFCAPPRPRAVVVPRTAIHQGGVYVVAQDDRLVIRDVEIRYRHGGFAVIDSGVEPGERVLVSDPVPAIEGMRLAPQTDKPALDDLVAEAKGAGACR